MSLSLCFCLFEGEGRSSYLTLWEVRKRMCVKLTLVLVVRLKSPQGGEKTKLVVCGEVR